MINVYEDDFCKVQLFEIECEYMYSNPTGMFNLSLSEKLMRTKNYTFMSYSQYRSAQGAMPVTEERDW
jgi:hypothetical protein